MLNKLCLPNEKLSNTSNIEQISLAYLFYNAVILISVI